MIRLITKKDGKTVMNRQANPTVSIDDILEIAEYEVMGGYADYACVVVDGKVYAEYEA